MRTAWRIVPWERRVDAFSGEGAARYGGRWNSPGTRVVYLSEHKSLAALEMLVHLPRNTTTLFAFLQAEFPNDAVEVLPPAGWPAHWAQEPPQADSQALGDVWVRQGRSAILAVPSALIPEELNFLLNPAHPEFEKFAIGQPVPFAFDARLLT